MFDAGVYPLRDDLKRLFSAKGIQEYDVNTVGYLVEELLKKTLALKHNSKSVTLFPRMSPPCLTCFQSILGLYFPVIWLES